MIIIDWLKWYFGLSGIVVAEEAGRISWGAAFIRLLSGGVKRNPNGPLDGDLTKWMAFHRPLRRYKCRVCGVYFWSWKNRWVCYKFSCFRRSK